MNNVTFLRDFVGGIVLVILVAVGAAYFLSEDQKECERRGGITVHSHCIKKEVVIW